MEQHSEIGERILANVEDYAEIARSSVTITSEWTVTVIPTGFPDKKFHYLTHHHRRGRLQRDDVRSPVP